MISILLVVDDVVLLTSSPEGLQRILDRLASFCDMRQLVVNLEKTHVMVFNGLKTSHLHFTSRIGKLRLHHLTHTLGLSFPDLVLA